MRRRRRNQLVLGALFGIVVWWITNTVTHHARVAYETSGLEAAIDAADDGLIDPQLTISTNPTDLLVASVVLVVLLVFVVWRVFGEGERRPGEEHGSARWGEPGDIAPFMARQMDRNLLLTRTERLSLDRKKKVEHQRNLNVLVLGAAGSGKSRFFIEPNLVNAAITSRRSTKQDPAPSTSYVVTDSKGALLESCGQALIDSGHKIRSLNLIDLAASDTFNPMAYLRPGHEPEDVQLMVRNIITNTENGRGGMDPFWERAETALLSALIGFVAAIEPPHKQNLGEVVDLLGKMQASFSEQDTSSEADRIFHAASQYLADHPSLPRADLLNFALANYRIYQQAAGKTAASIIVTAAARLAPLHIPAVRRLVTTDTLNLDAVGFEPTAIFIIVSDVNRQFSWLSALAFTVLFQRGVYLADRQIDRHVPVPVMCFMDEFANIGRIPDFEIVAATIRSRGFAFVAVVQNIGQGEALYEDGWAAIVGNCDTVLFLGSADPETKEFISKALGQQTIIVDDSSRSYGGQGSWSTSRRAQGRELLTADEVGRIPGDKAIVLIRGLPPFLSRKLAPIRPHPPYRHRATEGAFL